MPEFQDMNMVHPPSLMEMNEISSALVLEYMASVCAHKRQHGCTDENANSMETQ